MNQHATSTLPRYDAKTFKYLQSHKIFSLFESLLLSLVINRPEAPSGFLVEQLKCTVPIRIEEDDVIDLAAHNKNVLHTIQTLASHGLAPTPSFLALFASPSFAFLPGVNEEFKEEEIEILGDIEFQQDLGVCEGVTSEGHTKEQPLDDKTGESEVEVGEVVSEYQLRVEPINNKDSTEMSALTTLPSEPPMITNLMRPRDKEAIGESVVRSLEMLGDDDQPTTTTKAHRPRRVKQPGMPEEAPDDYFEDGKTEAGEAPQEELAEILKVKRGKRNTKHKTKQKDIVQQDALQDQSVEGGSGLQSSPSKGPEQSAALSNDSNINNNSSFTSYNINNNNTSFTSYNINNNNPSFTRINSYTINRIPSSSTGNLLARINSSLVSTDNTTLGSAMHQSMDKSVLPTIGSVKKVTSFQHEGESPEPEAPEPEPPKPKPNKFESNTLTKLRYQPQQLSYLSQPIRLQQSDYEQQILESQLQQQLHQQQLLQQRPLHSHTHIDSTPLLLHNQLYPQAGEVPLQPQHSNTDSSPLQNSQQKNLSQITQPQNTHQNQRRNSITATQTTDLVTQQKLQNQNDTKHHLSSSNQSQSQPVPPLRPLSPQINTPKNIPPTSSPLQSPHLPKLTTAAPNSSEATKETLSTPHLPPLTESAVAPYESTLNSNPQQFSPHPTQNQPPAAQRHPAPHSNQPQYILPDISPRSSPKHSPTQKQRMQRINTPYYPGPHDTDTPQDYLPDTPHSSRSDLSQPNIPTHPATHTDATHDFPQHQDIFMHSAPLPSSWLHDTGSKQGDNKHLDRMVSAPVAPFARSMNDITTPDDDSSPRPSQPTIPPPFHGVHYHTPARPHSSHSRRKSTTITSSLVQINAHTQCNHAHRTHNHSHSHGHNHNHNKLERAQSR